MNRGMAINNMSHLLFVKQTEVAAIKEVFIMIYIYAEEGLLYMYI